MPEIVGSRLNATVTAEENESVSRVQIKDETVFALLRTHLFYVKLNEYRVMIDCFFLPLVRQTVLLKENPGFKIRTSTMAKM